MERGLDGLLLRLLLLLALYLASGVSSLQLHRELPSASQEEELEQILGDGQPEDIGYGFQRSRTIRPSSYQGLMSAPAGWQDSMPEVPSQFRERFEAKRQPDDDDVPVLSSPFRERMAARQRRQRERGRQHLDLEHLLGLHSGAGTRRPDSTDNMMTDLSERELEALGEMWERWMQTGAIDVGPDELTDLEALQVLGALESASTGSDRKRSPRSSSWDWYNSSPLAWSGYQLRKRSVPTTEVFEDSDGVWSEDPSEVAGVDDADPAGESSALAARARLAMLISPQLFDERYNDPSVKRLLLNKRSLPLQQHGAMRRRKKSAPSSDTAQPPANDPAVQRDLAHIFGEPEPPRALPLASAQAVAGTTGAPINATATPSSEGSNPNSTKPIGHDQHGPMNPIGMAHETDKLAREHQGHDHAQPTTAKTEASKHEHAPPMVAAEGSHAHDQTTVKEQMLDKVVVSGGAKEEPLALELRQQPLKVVKKSIDWSQYFGIDRRRKKSTSLRDMETNQINDDWLLRETLRAYAKASKPSNINKRVAVKKEGASPDALLLGSWPRGAGGGVAGSDEDYMGWEGEAGRCGAVTRLTEDCRLAVGSNDALLPLCVLYQACRLCGGAVGVPSGRSCDAELARQGAMLCSSGAGEAAACLAAPEAIAEVRRSRYGGDTDICARQPCLARFFLASPAVAFSR